MTGQPEDCEGVLNSLWAFALDYQEHSDTTPGTPGMNARPTGLSSVDGLQAAGHEPADVLPEVSQSDGGYECAFGSLLRGRAVRLTGVRQLSRPPSRPCETPLHTPR